MIICKDWGWGGRGLSRSTTTSEFYTIKNLNGMNIKVYEGVCMSALFSTKAILWMPTKKQYFCIENTEVYCAFVRCRIKPVIFTVILIHLQCCTCRSACQQLYLVSMFSTTSKYNYLFARHHRWGHTFSLVIYRCSAYRNRTYLQTHLNTSLLLQNYLYWPFFLYLLS